MDARRFDLTCSQCEKDERGRYELPVRCSNCGASGIGVFSKGHESYHREECPDCECRTLSPDYSKASNG